MPLGSIYFANRKLFPSCQTIQLESYLLSESEVQSRKASAVMLATEGAALQKPAIYLKKLARGPDTFACTEQRAT